ncbi:MAG TPA: hypothetical protein VIU11_06960 [Nakamurella sp.]
MTELTAATSTRTARHHPVRVAARWMVTFLGFPLGGFAAMLLVGPVDDPWAAMLGGLITGLAIGGAQILGLGRGGPAPASWIAATAIGLTVGLTVGAAVVDYGTDLAALVIQGFICGFAVGTAQAFTLRPRLGRLALAWPAALAVIWPIGWAVTTVAGIQVDEQFTVFGSFGAIAVTVCTLVLPLVLNENGRSASR